MVMDKSTLENLPVELRMQILLNLSDIYSLRSIVYSSPAYHQAYLLVRQEALRNVLLARYDGLVEISEAIAAVRSEGLHADTASNREKIIALLDSRRRSQEIRHLRTLSGRTTPLPDEPTDIDEILRLFKLQHIAVFLLDDYCQTALCPPWMDLEKWNSEILPLKLSRTEKTRFFRAFYRLQTYCNIFGTGENLVDSGEYKPYLEWDKNFGQEEAWRMCFGPLSPWEVEEFGCIWQHVHDRNRDIYHEIAQDLLQYGNGLISGLPKNLGILPSCSVLDCDDLSIGEFSVRETLASIGPMFLYKLLKANDYMARRNIVLANRAFNVSTFSNFSPRSPDEQLPLLYPADRFNFGLDLDGLKAFLATLPDTKRPNIA